MIGGPPWPLTLDNITVWLKVNIWVKYSWVSCFRCWWQWWADADSKKGGEEEKNRKGGEENGLWEQEAEQRERRRRGIREGGLWSVRTEELRWGWTGGSFRLPHADRLLLIYKNRQNTPYYIRLRDTAAGCNTYIPTHTPTRTHSHSWDSEFITSIYAFCRNLVFWTSHGEIWGFYTVGTKLDVTVCFSAHVPLVEQQQTPVLFQALATVQAND